MIKLIIEKELRETIGSMKFAISFAVCSLLVILSFYVGARNYQTWSRQYEAAQRENMRQLEGLTDWIAVQQHRIFLPPQPLAALVSGISNDIGRAAEVRGRGELSVEGSRFSEDPLYAIFRFLDLEFIFQVILSLFAILFAYDAISGEKERGTLRLSFSNAVPKDRYILGKIIGCFVALAVPLLIPITVGCLVLPMLGVPFTGSEWVQLLAVIGAGFLFFGVFLTLSVMVSCLTRRTSSAFLVLLVVWIVAVLIVPRSATLLAARAVSVPSVDEIASQKQRLSSQLWTEDRKKMSEFTPATGMQPDKIMEEFNKFMQNIADERDGKMQKFSSALNEERENRQRAQQNLALGLARISPAAAFSLAASTFAGTSLTLERSYKDAAAEYQKSFAAFMKEKTGMLTGGRMMVLRSIVDDQKKPEPINPHELPKFNYQPPAIASVLQAGMLDLGLLVFFNLIFFLGSYIAFLRYDVR